MKFVWVLLFGCTSASGFQAEHWRAWRSVDGVVWDARRGGPAGPGNNRWSSPQLRGSAIVLRSDQRSTEISTPLPSSSVRVEVEIEAVAPLDPGVVLGVFFYRHDQSELDFEVSRWGEPHADNAQWVMVPATRDRMWRFELGRGPVTLRMEWRASRVTVETRQGANCWRWSHPSPLEDAPHRLHLNLWRRVSGRPAQVVVRRVRIDELSGARGLPDNLARAVGCSSQSSWHSQGTSRHEP